VNLQSTRRSLGEVPDRKQVRENGETAKTEVVREEDPGGKLAPRTGGRMTAWGGKMQAARKERWAKRIRYVREGRALVKEEENYLDALKKKETVEIEATFRLRGSTFGGRAAGGGFLPWGNEHKRDVRGGIQWDFWLQGKTVGVEKPRSTDVLLRDSPRIPEQSHSRGRTGHE